MEREVLALCIERSRQVRDWADALASGRAAIAAISGAPVPDGPAPDLSADQVAALETEIADLRTRIARLEGAPEQPETAGALAGLRGELATAEAALAQARSAQAPLPQPGAVDRIAEPAEETPDAARPSPAGAPDPTTAQTAPAEAVPVTARPDPEPDPGRTGSPPVTPASETAVPVTPTSVTPAPVAPSPPTNVASPTGPQGPEALPPDRPTRWQLVHAVRRGEAPWQVRLQGSREIAISVPGATAEDPPTVRWQVVSDPPVTVAVGERLPDGLILEAVSVQAVVLRDPLTPDAPPLRLLFEKDPAPGALDWVVKRLDEEGS